MAPTAVFPEVSDDMQNRGTLHTFSVFVVGDVEDLYRPRAGSCTLVPYEYRTAVVW